MNEEVKEEIEALMSIYEEDMEGKFIIPVSNKILKSPSQKNSNKSVSRILFLNIFHKKTVRK